MALIPATNPSVSTANPTASLVEALRNFEGSLSIDQLQDFRKSTQRPDASSVMSFVSKIDAENKTRAGRCIAPRLCTFLEAVRQFSEVVDTFVNSNPTTAALVWGGVRMAIVTASNITSYFDKITSLIMTVGRSCPTYKQFGLLYPNRIDLQTALCEYFAIVIRLCMKIMEISRRSGIVHVLSPIFNPFEIDFKSYQDELDQAVKDVQLQISLASKQDAREEAQLAEIERKANSRQRTKLFAFQKDVSEEQLKAQDWRLRATVRETKKIKAAIKDNLSTLDYTQAWKRAQQQCVRGTALWFQQDPDFCKWMEDEKTSVLWCSGKLGSGKTVFVSSVVAHLHLTQRPSDLISYFFCQPDLTASRTARNILGSIARQLLESYIDRAESDCLTDLYTESQRLDAEGVIAFLAPKLGNELSTFVILDGLDECEKEEVDLLSRTLNMLCNSCTKGLKVFCAGRPGVEHQIFKNPGPSYRISLATEKIDSDIKKYIEATLYQRLEDQKLKLGDSTLILRIRDALQEGAQGM
jgi:NACHT domain